MIIFHSSQTSHTNFVDKCGTEATTVRYGGYHSVVRRLPQCGTEATKYIYKFNNEDFRLRYPAELYFNEFFAPVRNEKEGISMTSTTIIDNDKKSHR